MKKISAISGSTEDKLIVSLIIKYKLKSEMDDYFILFSHTHNNLDLDYTMKEFIFAIQFLYCVVNYASMK